LASQEDDYNCGKSQSSPNKKLSLVRLGLLSLHLNICVFVPKHKLHVFEVQSGLEKTQNSPPKEKKEKRKKMNVG
jgi:hypothetical protein